MKDNSQKRAEDIESVIEKIKEMQDKSECGRIEAHFFMGGLSTIHKLTTYKPNQAEGRKR